MIFGIYALNPRGSLPAVRRAMKRLESPGFPGTAHIGGAIGLRSADGKSSFFTAKNRKARIVYTGEIYNYPDLRRKLERAGYQFISELDSELILHAYDKWGPDCQRKFNGQWSFAIWDDAKQRLFCSRDRFGLRPFYYFFNGTFLVFGSLIRSFFSCSFINKEPNDRAVFDYLVLNRANHREETFFKDINQLEAGCCLLLSARGKPEIRRYYNPAYNPEMGDFDKNRLKEHSLKFRRLLEDSIKIRSGPPYPIGSMLSGGLDSSSITCLADRFFRKDGSGGDGLKKLKVFSIPWEGESEYIEAVSRAVGFAHCRILPQELKKISWKEAVEAALSSEKPLTMTPFFGEIRILRRAEKERMRALFDGEGGDELLAGYPERYFTVYLNQLIRGGKIAGFLREFKALHSGRLKEFGITKKNQSEFYKIFLRTQSALPELSEFFPQKTLNPVFYREHLHRKAQSTPRLDLNLQKVLRRETLNLGGEFHAAGAIERRRPFLDHRLVDYVLSLPLCYKLHDTWTKYLLRAAMDGVLPQRVCWRKKKIGGTVPISVWKDFLKKNKRKLKAVLSGREFRSAGFLDQKAVLEHFDELFSVAVSPKTTDISGLWRFANLELWFRKNL